MKRVSHIMGPADAVQEASLTAMISVDGFHCAVARSGDTAYAVGDVCPHQNAPLHGAPVSEGHVTCLKHCYRFDLRSGDCLTVGGYGLPIYPARIEGGLVVVDNWED